MNTRKYFIIAFIVIVIDQASKLLVNHYMYLHQEVNVIGEWFRLHYLLNPGMAFGIKWESDFGKLALTFFRIVAMFGITWYMINMNRKGAHNGFLICLALILGGAIGNVIDSIFYGVLLNNAPLESVTPWFHGQVIDMLYFPIYEFYFPDWFPFRGGENFLFFSPVFNIADSSIFIGVVTILFSQKRFFKEHVEETVPISPPAATDTADLLNYGERGVEEHPFVKEEFNSSLDNPDDGPASDAEKSA